MYKRTGDTERGISLNPTLKRFTRRVFMSVEILGQYMYDDGSFNRRT